jgi:hypothetical protein
MKFSFAGREPLPWVLWACAVIAAAMWAWQPGYVVGWDARVLRDAIWSLRGGRDPYSDALAAQEAFRRALAQQPGLAVPFSYVYSPVTLPLLRWVSKAPLWLSGSCYGGVYLAGTLAIVWVGTRFALPAERAVMRVIAPLAVFFPGLLQNDVLFSGNVAFFLYGGVLLAAWRGWRRGRWFWFYAAVLAASCCKAPMLSLLAIAPLSGRRQWRQGAFAAVAGVALFWAQAAIWPLEMERYLRTLDDMFRLGRDFSASPAGLVSEALYPWLPYRLTLTGAYVLYALPVFAVLVALSRRSCAGEIAERRWLPVLLLGVMLLNPRIIEYDAAAITLPMALVAWRLRPVQVSRRTLAAGAGLAFLSVNALMIAARMAFAPAWRCGECVLLVGLFVAGARQLQTGRKAAMAMPVASG